MASLPAQLKAANIYNIYMCISCVWGGRLVSQKSSCCESCCARFSRGTGPETPQESPAGPGPKLPGDPPRAPDRNSRGISCGPGTKPPAESGPTRFRV